MVEKLRLPFSFLSDPDRTAAIEPYGLSNPTDRRQIAIPAMVVVTSDGEEAYRFVSRDFADRLTEDELLGVLRDLDLPPAKQDPPEIGPAEAGPNAMPVRALAPYFRGARFAAAALGLRHPTVKEDTDRYVSQMDRYGEALAGLRGLG